MSWLRFWAVPLFSRSMISIGSSPMWNFRRSLHVTSTSRRRTKEEEGLLHDVIPISTTDISRRPKLTPPIPGVLLTWGTTLTPPFVVAAHKVVALWEALKRLLSTSENDCNLLPPPETILSQVSFQRRSSLPAKEQCRSNRRRHTGRINSIVVDNDVAIPDDRIIIEAKVSRGRDLGSGWSGPVRYLTWDAIQSMRRLWEQSALWNVFREFWKFWIHDLWRIWTKGESMSNGSQRSW